MYIYINFILRVSATAHITNLQQAAGVFCSTIVYFDSFYPPLTVGTRNLPRLRRTRIRYYEAPA